MQIQQNLMDNKQSVYANIYYTMVLLYSVRINLPNY